MSEPDINWKKVSTKVLLDHPRLIVVEDDVVLPDGHATKYLRFDKQEDSVCIVCVNDKNETLFTKEYAYPIGERIYNLPGGGVEPGEEMVDAARRELLEEAGYEAEDFTPVGKMYVNTRRTPRRVHIVLAKNGVRPSNRKTSGDPEEQGTTNHWLSPAELTEMFASGDIMQAESIAAIRICESLGF